MRQLFLWSLTGGTSAAKAASATRVALYNAYPVKGSVTGYWLGTQVRRG